ncbi:MAG: GGDEF domain-containing protein [Acidobacteriota bacterium]
MTTNPHASTHGTALLCDETGIIAEILFNELQIPSEDLIGRPFPQIVTASSISKALSFVVELRKEGKVLDCEMDLELAGQNLLIHVVGIKLKAKMLVMIAKTSGAVNHLLGEMVRINSDQSSRLRSATKSQVELELERPKLESRHFDELTSLNNEMCTLQRELAKKNAELEMLYAEVQSLAITDTLTGLLNRRGFFDLGIREVERFRRFAEPMCGLMFDLDHFKRFNDTYGHAVGDEVLQEVAVRCKRELRQIDIIGRYGGEEFAVFLPGTDIVGAYVIGERLRNAINSEPFATSSGPLTVSISLGAAFATAQISTPEELLAVADKALYKAKEAGRNCVCIADQ